MRARSSMMPLVGAASLLIAGAATVRAASSPVQLLEVRSRQDAGRSVVLLEASAPVAFTSAQPDPFTVVIDLRHARAAETVTLRRPTLRPPVADVSVHEAVTADGVPVARVRLALAEPSTARVHSKLNTVVVEFPDLDVPGPLASPAVATAGVSATELVSISSELTGGGARVRLRGNGLLRPKTVEEARDLPPRILLDLPGVRSRVPAVQAVGGQPLSRIRVATNSESPLITRVVFDLTHKVPFRTAHEGGDLVVVLGEHEPGIAAAAGPAEARPRTQTTGVAEPSVDRRPGGDAAPVATRPMARPSASSSGSGEAAPPAVSVVIAAEPELVADHDASAGPAKTAASPADSSATAANPAASAGRSASPPVGAAGAVSPASPERARAASGSAAGTAQPAAAPATAPAPPAQVTPPTAALAGGGEPARQFTGHPVSLDFQGVDLRAVLRTFAEITGLNLVIDQQVEGKVDVALRDVPWDQALDIILRANKLGYTVEGTIVRIAPLSVLAAEEALKRKLAEEKAMAGDLELMTRTLNYANARTVEPLLKGVLSSRGRTAVDTRTNTLILYDLPDYLPRVARLLDTLDQPEMQVEIEARIIQTTKKFARELGVRWGFNGALAPELGNTLPVAFPHSGTAEGAAGPLAPGRVRGRDVVGITMRAINGAFNINAELSALEEAGQVKTLLTPRIVTQNNVKAVITRGQEIPYTTTTASPPPGGATVIAPVPTVQFRTAALTLAVTPRITAANTVILEVDVDNGSPGDTQANGNRAINTQRAQTTVLVADGATTVIGGIQGNTTEESERRTPGLWRLPIFGHLFRDRGRESVDEEILIFITPRIIRVPATPAPAAFAMPPAQ